MALSYAFDPTKGETPQSVAQSRAAAQQLAARIFGRAPQNVGEGLSAIGQALVARSMMDEASAAQKVGLASGNDAFSQITSAITGQPSIPGAPAPMGNTNIPVSGGEVVPNDNNAIPGTVGMNQRLADLSQDFIQDNPGTYLSSGVRSTADQARLYANRDDNPNPVAAPGTSRHERGLAVDISGMTPEQRAMLPQYGLGQPVANDPPHVELGAPAAPVQVASSDPRFAPAAPQSDGAALPPNAQPTQGTMPQRSTGPTTQQLMQAASNPWLSDGQRSVVSIMLKQRLEQEQQAADPLRRAQLIEAQGKIDAMPLDRRGKELSNMKLERELQGEGATPLTSDERSSFGIPEGQAAYKTRDGAIKFGPAGTKINVGDGEGAFAKEAGKATAQRLNDLVSDGQQARQTMSDMSTLLDLGKNIGTGKGAQVKAVLGPFAEAAGLKVDGLSDIQAYEAIVNRVGPSLRVKGSGAQSDYELKNFLKSIPTLGNTQEGNEMTVAVMNGLQQNKVLASEIASKALAGEITRTEAEKQLRELPDPMQPYRDYKAKRSKVDGLLEKYGPR